MSQHVHWLLELSINDGKLADFIAVMHEMVASTKNEGGTLIYEWCFSEDETVCDIYERFRDSDAAMAHLAAFSQFAERFLDAATPTKLTVMGHPNGRALEALSGLSPALRRTRAGFAHID